METLTTIGHYTLLTFAWVEFTFFLVFSYTIRPSGKLFPEAYARFAAATLILIFLK
jgi:hypothetical protein